jgi:hypothetical protein
MLSKKRTAKSDEKKKIEIFVKRFFKEYKKVLQYLSK